MVGPTHPGLPWDMTLWAYEVRAFPTVGDPAYTGRRSEQKELQAGSIVCPGHSGTGSSRLRAWACPWGALSEWDPGTSL